MNRKFLILFSLLIVAIGISGILLNPDKEIPELLAQTEKRKEKNIVLAQTRHDLSAGALVSRQDYSLQNITVDESSGLVKNDLSHGHRIDGHLLKNNILAGSYITDEMLISPNSHEFSQLNLKNGEIIYKFFITKKNEYLLNTLNPGDFLSFQLLTLETNKAKGMENGIAIDSNSMNSKQRQKYSLNNVIPNMPILSIKTYSSEELSVKNNKNNKTEEYSLGYIEVIMKIQDLEFIHTVEKAGEVFLIPKSGDHKRIDLDEIIPTLQTIRELRG
ncbi:tight adherance operon protein [Yersinia similis]|uniref:tight adherance operon protein n=1 Tax=Yersinia similis TaxID=367190 RepID=UPI00061C19C3|nr:tight adherance operon protein [Yersinia similis]CNB96089.1 Flp pilus assembly protein RcpC/CpaB [Yersinia similis]